VSAGRSATSQVGTHMVQVEVLVLVRGVVLVLVSWHYSIVIPVMLVQVLRTPYFELWSQQPSLGALAGWPLACMEPLEDPTSAPIRVKRGPCLWATRKAFSTPR
jgi:hypothetical protein